MTPYDTPPASTSVLQWAAWAGDARVVAWLVQTLQRLDDDDDDDAASSSVVDDDDDDDDDDRRDDDDHDAAMAAVVAVVDRGGRIAGQWAGRKATEVRNDSVPHPDFSPLNH